jgi:hypothetical protein
MLKGATFGQGLAEDKSLAEAADGTICWVAYGCSIAYPRLVGVFTPSHCQSLTIAEPLTRVSKKPSWMHVVWCRTYQLLVAGYCCAPWQSGVTIAVCLPCCLHVWLSYVQSSRLQGACISLPIFAYACEQL